MLFKYQLHGLPEGFFFLISFRLMFKSSVNGSVKNTYIHMYIICWTSARLFQNTASKYSYGRM